MSRNERGRLSPSVKKPGRRPSAEDADELFGEDRPEDMVG
jgi:hypothetical protein